MKLVKKIKVILAMLFLTSFFIFVINSRFSVYVSVAPEMSIGLFLVTNLINAGFLVFH